MVHAKEDKMGQRGDSARADLMDAAEELFARQGIEATSSRQIAEFAGQANHSAVRYHFGTRDEIVKAIVLRHRPEVNARRQEWLAALQPDADLRALLACRVMPWIDTIAALPVPSWHARFLAQLPPWAPARELLVGIERADTGSPVDELNERIATLLRDIPENDKQGRADILGRLILGVCAAYEGDVESGAKRPNWPGVGNFIIDASAGMLAAPVTHRGDAPVTSAGAPI